MSVRPKESWHCSLTRITLPSERDAADRASSRLMPFARFSSICWSRWNRNSASSSLSTRLRPKTDRKRHFNVLAQRIDPLCAADDQINRARQSVPIRQFLFEPPFAGTSQRVELCLTPGLGLSPVGLHPPLLFEPIERGIQRALLHLQRLFRDVLDALPNSPAVFGLQRNNFQNEKIQGA